MNPVIHLCILYRLKGKYLDSVMHCHAEVNLCDANSKISINLTSQYMYHNHNYCGMIDAERVCFHLTKNETSIRLFLNLICYSED